MNAFLDLADRQISAPRKARLRAAEQRAATRAEKAQAERERQLARWRAWSREREESLLASPHARAVRELFRLLNTLTPDAGEVLIKAVARGPWQAADRDVRFRILAVIDGAIVEMRERYGLPPFDDPIDEPLNVFLILRELLS